jgi:hypothetical protein
MDEARGSSFELPDPAVARGGGRVLPLPEPSPDARTAFEQLRRAIRELEARLGPEQDAAVRVLSFGQALLVHSPEIRCFEPALISPRRD